MIRILFFFLLITAFYLSVYTQQMHLYSTTVSGGTAAGPGGRVSYAIGQPFYTKSFSADAIVSQGIIQLLSYSSDPLPITLLSFVAWYNADEQIVELTWITSSEIGNDYFTIERSANGSDFEPIGNVDGAGFSNNIQKYDFIDEKPLPGISYYRLKQTDYDGAYDYSPVVAIRIDGVAPELSVYPNPATQYIHIRLHNPLFLETRWELVSLNGQLVKTGSFQSHDETIHLSDLPGGTWLLRVYRADFERNLKIIKK